MRNSAGGFDTTPVGLKLVFHFSSVKELRTQRFYPIDSKFRDYSDEKLVQSR